MCVQVCGVSVWRRIGLGSGNAAKVCDIYPNKVGKQLTNERLGRKGQGMRDGRVFILGGGPQYLGRQGVGNGRVFNIHRRWWYVNNTFIDG